MRGWFDSPGTYPSALEKIRQHHADSDGLMGPPRMHEVLGYEGQTVRLNRIARLMAQDGLFGVSPKRRWHHKLSGVGPAHVRNYLERDFVALEPHTKWVIDITHIKTGEGRLYLCAVSAIHLPLPKTVTACVSWSISAWGLEGFRWPRCPSPQPGGSVCRFSWKPDPGISLKDLLPVALRG